MNRKSKTLLRKLLVMLIALLSGGLSIWATRSGTTRGINDKNALAVLELKEAEASATKDFTTTKTLSSFFVVIKPRKTKEEINLSLKGGDTTFVGGGFRQYCRISCGRDVPPGNFTVTLKQNPGGHGGTVSVAEYPVGMTGWQIYSRVFVGSTALAGILAFAARRSKNLRHRTASRHLFLFLLLAVALIFLYLLFHEGGHALVSFFLGRYDYASSDFWGIHGSPHSGVDSDVHIKPWQQAAESFGGPMFPALVSWVLFLFWRSRTGKRLRLRPILNVYFSAIVAMLAFPFVVVVACLLGITNDGDWNGFIENVPGPLWLVKALLIAALVANLLILTRVVPEIRRAMRASLRLDNPNASGTNNQTSRACGTEDL